jgi:hypothetical protein
LLKPVSTGTAAATVRATAFDIAQGPLNPDFDIKPGGSTSFRPIAALQRDWRGFRIAEYSCERDDAALPKIWTGSAWSRSREQEPWRLQ